MWLQVFLITQLLAFCSHSYKILVVFPLPTQSHSILGEGIVSALAKANHQVTYITPYPKNSSDSNVRVIGVTENVEEMPDDTPRKIRAIFDNVDDVNNHALFISTIKDTNVKTIKNEDVQRMLNDPNEHFDVVILEWMFLELLSGLSAIFNCPYIWVSCTEPHWKVLRLIDEMPNPAYTSDMISANVPPFTFTQRIQELFLQLKGIAWEYYTINPIQTEAYKTLLAPIIRKRGYDVPRLEDLKYNASLVLSNSHLSIGKTMRLPQNFIQVAGFHIDRDVKPLPADLKQILDESKHGVIYFSLGSIVKSRFIPDELKRTLLNMFGELKYTVLWKFEEDLPNKPSNVHIVQWAPQQSILGHPNCRLFITHGGLLSITEAIHFGKPLIVIPIFADQYKNAITAVEKGIAKKVELSLTMANDINNSIEEILSETRYLATMKELSMIYHARPVTPDKELVHWVEHVVKTRGASHLRSPAFAVTWYQKLYLDFTALITVTLIVAIALARTLLSYMRFNIIVKKKKQ